MSKGCLQSQEFPIPREPFFCRALQSYNLPAARELFKPFTDSAKQASSWDRKKGPKWWVKTQFLTKFKTFHKRH